MEKRSGKDVQATGVRKRRPFQSIMLFLGIVTGVLVVGLILWWSILFHQFGLLLKRSSHFPNHYAVGPPNSAPIIYVVMGDSTAFGTGASSLQTTYPYQVAQHLAAGGRHVQVINVAVVGARLLDVVQKQLPAVQRLHPAYVTLSVGANDATHLTSGADYRQSLADLLTGLGRLPSCTVAFANTPDMGVVPALPFPYRSMVAKRARLQNTILDALLRGTPFRLVDLFHRGRLDAAENPHYYAGDRFHPADAGYRVWAGLFCEALDGTK